MNHPQELTYLINTLADEDGPEPSTIVCALQPLMAPILWTELAHAWEICPKHVVDEHICRDDQDECEAGMS